MNHKYLISYFILSLLTQNIHAGFAANTTKNNEMFASSTLSPNNQQSMKNLVDTVSTYPALGSSQNKLHQIIRTRKTKNMLPLKTTPLLQKGNFSILRPGANLFKNYPNGSSLFPNFSDISEKFNTMITLFQTSPHFIPFFRKVHINILNELYHYLISIYVNFNLQHVGIQQATDGSMKISLPLYLQQEDLYSANTKTLIINHLMSIIESQFNASIRSYVPKLPQTFATFIGKTAIQNDFSIDLTQFIIKQLEPQMIKTKKTYLTALASYLDFFQLFTSYLEKPHSQQPNDFTAFVDIAEQINQFLYSNTSTTSDKQIIALSKMNPPLFHFSYDDIQALKIIPYLAQSIPKNSQKILWPEQIVEAAQQGIVISPSGQKPHPLAYFRTNDGVVVRNLNNDPSIDLFICMRVGENLYEEKLIAQPDWLNSWEGIVKILRACYGDFSALLGMNILDPCMESLITNVVYTQQGKDPNNIDNTNTKCQKFIESWQKKTTQSSSSSINNNSSDSFNLPIPMESPPLLLQPGIKT